MKKLLLTGYPGFLASAIKEWFEKNDWQVDTLGILPFPDGESQSGSHIICNIAESVPDLPDVTYDMVIHAAGKAHVVPKTEAEKQAFYDINVKGTEHVLSALQKHPPSSLVFISSVAVYGVETGENIADTAPLLAKTPYGESKIDELAKNYGTEVLAKLPIDSELASLSDKGVIELFEGDYLESCADIIEKSLS